MKNVSFTITKDTVSLVLDGKLFTIQKSYPHFKKICQLLCKEEYSDLPRFLSSHVMFASWAGETGFSLIGDNIYFEGKPVPESFQKRLIDIFQSRGNVKPLCQFFRRLAQNPSKRSIDQLFTFLQNQNIPITPDGTFLAYKGVTDEYKDIHTGTWDNTPGVRNKMPRNEVCDDPDIGCSQGFHVGSLDYAKGYGKQVVICEVAPEHVVSIPRDSSFQKARVSEYKVIGYYGMELPSTLISARDIPVIAVTKKEKKSVAATKKKATSSRRERQKLQKRLARFDKLATFLLREKSLKDLRAYATHRLHIVGASKVKQGKEGLIKLILKRRDTYLATK